MTVVNHAVPAAAGPRSLHAICELARLAACDDCQASGPQWPCVASADGPDGFHIARFAAAARRGLLTAADVTAVTEAAGRGVVIYDETLGGGRGTGRVTAVSIVSFGYLHGPAPKAHAVFDVRQHFKDPDADPALRALTAADARVRQVVTGTPGVRALIDSVAAAALAFRDGPGCGPVVIAVGCAGGRHRSAVIAAETGRLLQAAGIAASVTHRDITRLVTGRLADGAR